MEKKNKQTFILHIGYQKTATTSLQHFFYTNKHINFLGKSKKNNKLFLNNELRRYIKYYLIEENQKFYKKDCIKDNTEKLTKKIILLSEEGIINYRRNNEINIINKIMNQINFEKKLLISLRNQWEMLISLYLDQVNKKHYYHSFQYFVNNFEKTRNIQKLYYFNFIENIKRKTKLSIILTSYQDLIKEKVNIEGIKVDLKNINKKTSGIKKNIKIRRIINYFLSMPVRNKICKINYDRTLNKNLYIKIMEHTEKMLHYLSLKVAVKEDFFEINKSTYKRLNKNFLLANDLISKNYKVDISLKKPDRLKII